jgi:uracil-DNA glycosylase
MSLETLTTQIITCRKCPRLVDWREQVAHAKRKAYAGFEYWGRPVPGFGDPHARVLVVGLAPGAHGSNRTGRQFTGDASGNFLFPALFRAGFASSPDSKARDDGLVLTDLYLTAAARCAPPGNKPQPSELDKCQPYLEQEIELIAPRVIVALGRIAFDRILRIHKLPLSAYHFAHAAVYLLGIDPPKSGPWLIASYHPSQQNTLTGKLTVEMFELIWQRARELLEEKESS